MLDILFAWKRIYSSCKQSHVSSKTKIVQQRLREKLSARLGETLSAAARVEVVWQRLGENCSAAAREKSWAAAPVKNCCKAVEENDVRQRLGVGRFEATRGKFVGTGKMILLPRAGAIGGAPLSVNFYSCLGRVYSRFRKPRTEPSGC